MFLNSIFIEKDAPRYATAFIIVLVTAILTQILTIVYRYLCILENKKRDNSGIQEGYDHAYDDDVTDKLVSLPFLATRAQSKEQADPAFKEPPIPLHLLSTLTLVLISLALFQQNKDSHLSIVGTKGS